ncbi:hypothetical protein AMTR_s00022p00253340 [Amborella trichopoda]|uniref:Uncharacterized protein n=1 Tax=Amborella trichopoda TaxID=13333 RepID=W1PVE8_AMBTC|nr:hypothetical protein AMTR_s00022p00253340 [Amborella trichopoda]
MDANNGFREAPCHGSETVAEDLGLQVEEGRSPRFRGEVTAKDAMDTLQILGSLHRCMEIN